MVQRKRTVIGAILVTATLVLGACSSSGGNDEADDETTTTEAEETTTTEEETTTTEADDGDEEAQARAESVTLTTDDFPAGWTATPADPEEDDEGGIVDCAPIMGDDSAVLARHDTDEFVTGDLDVADGAQVSASTKVFEDEDAAQAVLEPFNDPEVIACIDDQLRGLFGADQGLDVQGEIAEDDPDLGTDAAEGLSGEYTIPQPDGDITAVVAVALFRSGDITSMMLILALGPSFDPSELEQPFVAIVERQQAA